MTFTVNNPYAQGGWFNPDNTNSINNEAWSPASPPQPSIFGALPFTPDFKPETILQFVFTFDKNIIDSIVMGPRNRAYVSVTNAQGTTHFCNASGTTFAVIEWEGQPVVEIHNLLKKQPVKSWLALSSDRTQRVMPARGRWYCWVPIEKAICLYVATHGLTPPTPCARLSRTNCVVKLDLTANAVQAGLLEYCVVAAVLLQSGRRID